MDAGSMKFLAYGANQKLKVFGISAPADKLEKWMVAKVIPSSARTDGEYEVSACEAAAAAYLSERYGWDQNRLMVARHHMGQTIEGKDNAVSRLNSFWNSGIEGQEEQYLDAMNWFFTVIKFIHGLPPNGGVEVLATEIPGAGVAYATEPAREDRISDGKEVSHPRPIEPPTGALIE